MAAVISINLISLTKEINSITKESMSTFSRDLSKPKPAVLSDGDDGDRDGDGDGRDGGDGGDDDGRDGGDGGGDGDVGDNDGDGDGDDDGDGGGGGDGTGYGRVYRMSQLCAHFCSDKKTRASAENCTQKHGRDWDL